MPVNSVSGHANPVKKRILELARLELGARKRVIRKVCRKEVIPNKRYSWLLYSSEADADPMETVVLDVDAAEALVIDQELGVAVQQISKFSQRGQITVLLVDDHKVLRQGLRSLLEAEYDIHVVGEAETGRQAVEMAKHLRPDVVLMDIAMPLLNGLEATRQIHAQHLKSKVLILSCHSDDAHVRRTIDAGAVGYLVKQTAAEDVVTAIREAQKGNAYFSPSISMRLVEIHRKASVSGESAGKLTLRESEVLQLVAEGYSSKQIAAQLAIGNKAVEKHRREIMHKLDIHSIAGLTRYALTSGMIENLAAVEGEKSAPGSRITQHPLSPSTLAASEKNGPE
jgi:DNA-binding NarL/FixJ family response regulator